MISAGRLLFSARNSIVLELHCWIAEFNCFQEALDSFLESR